MLGFEGEMKAWKSTTTNLARTRRSRDRAARGGCQMARLLVVDSNKLTHIEHAIVGRKSEPRCSTKSEEAHYQARILSEKSLIPVTLPACEMLLEKHDNHTLYYFLEIGARTHQCPAHRDGKASREWLILPQHKVVTLFQGWNGENKRTINEWLAGDGFRAFMSPRQRAQFKDPVVDCLDGRLVIRSGKGKLTPLR